MGDFFSMLCNQIVSTEVTLVNSVFRLLLSMVLGVLVGAERKRKGQIAGVRTFALISMGACLAMLLSVYVPQVYMGLKNGESRPYRRAGHYRRWFPWWRCDDSPQRGCQGG